MRELFDVATGPLPDVWTLQHPVPRRSLWAAAIMAIFIPLASGATSGWAGSSYCAPVRSSRSAAASPR